jgi:hypothetical protein
MFGDVSLDPEMMNGQLNVSLCVNPECPPELPDFIWERILHASCTHDGDSTSERLKLCKLELVNKQFRRVLLSSTLLWGDLLLADVAQLVTKGRFERWYRPRQRLDKGPGQASSTTAFKVD